MPEPSHYPGKSVQRQTDILQSLDIDQLGSVYGGADRSTPPTDETTGRCGIGPLSFGQTKECKAHDDCVGRWNNRVGRPLADAVCAPLLPAAAASAARCAADPNCPK